MAYRQFFFDVVLFPLSSLVTRPSFMSVSSLVLELWLYSFIKDWPEIRKSEIPPFVFCPISRDWYKSGIREKSGIRNLARISLIKCYWMLQNSRFTVFTISELLRENQQGWRRGRVEEWGVKFPHPFHLRLGLNLY